MTRGGIVRAILNRLQPVRKEIARLEALAETAYDTMYDVHDVYSAHECYEDASSYLFKAIALAKKARLKRIAARLQARWDHIYHVYDHQFRR